MVHRTDLLIVTLLALSSLSACTPSAERGFVVMKIADDAAHVDLGSGDVHVGQEVAVFRNDCTTGIGGPKRGRHSSCRTEQIGTGTVTEILNERYSVTKLDMRTPVKEGDIVELAE